MRGDPAEPVPARVHRRGHRQQVAPGGPDVQRPAKGTAEGIGVRRGGRGIHGGDALVAAAVPRAVRGLRQHQRVQDPGEVQTPAAVLQRRHPGHRVHRTRGGAQRLESHRVGSIGSTHPILRRRRGGRGHRRAHRHGARKKGDVPPRRHEQVLLHGQQRAGVQAAAGCAADAQARAAAAQNRIRARRPVPTRPCRRDRRDQTHGAHRRLHHPRRVRRDDRAEDGRAERTPHHHATE